MIKGTEHRIMGTQTKSLTMGIFKGKSETMKPQTLWYLMAMAMLCSSHSFAMPKVGDSATYRMDITDISGGVYIGGEIQNSLTDYDKKLKKFKVKNVIKYDTGKKDERVDYFAEDSFVTDDQIQKFLDNCIVWGYEKETIRYLDKDYVACKVKGVSDDGFTGYKWVAAVPFGYLKSSYFMSDQLKVETKLISYKK